MTFLNTGKLYNLRFYFHNNLEDKIESFIRTSNKEDSKSIFVANATQDYYRIFSIMLALILGLTFAQTNLALFVFFSFVSNFIIQKGANIESNLHMVFSANASLENTYNLLQVKSPFEIYT